MKKWIFFLAATGSLFLLLPSQSTGQVLVKVKPVAPKLVVIKPEKSKPHHVWIPGNWVWKERKNCYVWEQGHFVRARKGHVWEPGYWITLRGGHKWVPGHWQKVSAKVRLE